MTALGKSLVALIVLVIAGVVGLYYYKTNNPLSTTHWQEMPNTATTTTPSVATTTGLGPDPANSTYNVDSLSYRLADGEASLEIAPGSASKNELTLFGKPTTGDLSGDGVEDAAVLLVQSSGGSGSFYYVAASLNVHGRYQGTNAILLGDRIAPQTLEIRDGIVIANYATRKEGESMATSPSIGASLYAQVQNTELVQIRKPEGF